MDCNWRPLASGAVAASIVMSLVACGAPGRDDGKTLVVTTVAPLTDIARNVAGRAADVEGVIPEGADSHTFEPTPSTARMLADADLILVNGLDLEQSIVQLARANHDPGVEIGRASCRERV